MKQLSALLGAPGVLGPLALKPVVLVNPLHHESACEEAKKHLTVKDSQTKAKGVSLPIAQVCFVLKLCHVEKVP